MPIPYRKLFKSALLIKITVILSSLLLILYLKAQLKTLLFEERRVHHVTEGPIVHSSMSRSDVPQSSVARYKNDSRVNNYLTTVKMIINFKDPVSKWMSDFTVESQGSFVNYNKLFARLTNVAINPLLAKGRKGGEDKEDVLNQREEDEYLKLDTGYFTLHCFTPPSVGYDTVDHLNTWNKKVACGTQVKPRIRIQGMTLALMRYEYVNFYHTMTDFYNAFLVMLMFNQSPDNITVLWVDAHPKGSLDDTWGVLFGSTLRAGHMETRTQFDDMVWNINGHFSPLNQHHRQSVPYLPEFREFFLARHNVSFQERLNCEKLNILFIWRRDYVAHPRNPKGLVQRKISNEDEILSNIDPLLSHHTVRGVQLDILPMKKQLELIANTDILLGMHGAGLSHALFLPKHACLVELVPAYVGNGLNHFKSMADWRGLRYLKWKNYNYENEKANYSTYIPVHRVNKILFEARGMVCSADRHSFHISAWTLVLLNSFFQSTARYNTLLNANV